MSLLAVIDEHGWAHRRVEGHQVITVPLGARTHEVFVSEDERGWLLRAVIPPLPEPVSCLALAQANAASGLAWWWVDEGVPMAISLCSLGSSPEIVIEHLLAVADLADRYELHLFEADVH